MDVYEAIKGRRSVRVFDDRAIPREVEDRLAEALIWAPSAGNLQARKFFFVKNTSIKEQLGGAALGQGFIARAPLVVVACADHRIGERYGERGIGLYCLQDVAASIQNMMLLAHAEGLGSVWIGAFHEVSVRELLGLPENLRPVALVPVGWPGRMPSPPPRVSPSEAIEKL